MVFTKLNLHYSATFDSGNGGFALAAGEPEAGITGWNNEIASAIKLNPLWRPFRGYDILLYNNLALAKSLMASARRGPDRVCTLAEAGLIDGSQDSSFFSEKSRNS